MRAHNMTPRVYILVTSACESLLMALFLSLGVYQTGLSLVSHMMTDPVVLIYYFYMILLFWVESLYYLHVIYPSHHRARFILFQVGFFYKKNLPPRLTAAHSSKCSHSCPCAFCPWARTACSTCCTCWRFESPEVGFSRSKSFPFGNAGLGPRFITSSLQRVAL